MDQLQVQVARARRRLVIEQFVGRSVWCLLAALSIAAVAIAVPRIVVVESLPANWDSIWFLGALGAGLLGAAVWTIVARRTALDAAIEIDRRFELRERIASSLSLTPDDQTSEAGRALVGDASRAASRIDIDEKFRLRVDRRAWWPLVPALAVFVLVTFFENRPAESSDPNSAENVRKRTKLVEEASRKPFDEMRKKAAEQKLEEAGELAKQIQEGLRDLSDKPDLDRSKVQARLNDLAEQLDERKQKLGGGEEIKNQLQKMNNIPPGPAEKAAQAMKEGDWKQALEEIEKLQDQLKNGKLDEQAKKDLANQLEQMKQKMEAAAGARQQAMEDLQKQIEQQKQQGNNAKAAELQQKLDKLQQGQQQMNALQKLAQQMGMAQEGLKQGDGQKAADAIAKMAEQLQQIQKDGNEMKMLDQMMNDLQMAKDMMACQACAGGGCEACQGNGNKPGNMGMGGLGENMNGPPGMGMGAGRGTGPRPEEKNDTNVRESRVRQQVGRGGAVRGDMVEGPNVKGDVIDTIKAELESLGSKPADPLTNERLPGSRREHATQYFDILRDGK